MIIGYEKVIGDLDKLESMDLVETTREAIGVVQKSARDNVTVNTGRLRDSIYARVQTQDGYVIGECGTDEPYGSFVEFGTGPRGAMNHAGVAPDVQIDYADSPWWIHESQLDRGVAEKYHWYYVDTSKGRFYYCAGQSAQPYLYPALVDNLDNIRGIYEKAISL